MIVCENGKYYYEIIDSTTLYARNAYTLSVNYNHSNYTNINTKVYTGESISAYFPTLNNEMGIQTTSSYNTDRTFLGYSQNVPVMPQNNLIVEANWQIVNWATITFVTTVASPNCSTSVTETKGNAPSLSSVRVNLDSNLSYSSTFTSYTGTTSYQVKKGWSDATFTLKIVGWNKSSVSNVSSISVGIKGLYYSFTASNTSSSYNASALSITGHTTLYAVWAIQ